ncbi:MAG: MAPEG family protein [Hyphomicrobiales bacterium]|nr:MAPEG family protein [Hyphomicrobiales bacterium]
MTIAFWCVFIAGLLPYAAFAVIAGSLDPHLPRLAAQKLEGAKARANGAHLNAFEAFGFFAAAVIIAHLIEGANLVTNALAVAFIIMRIGHLVFYIADNQPLRSAAFTLGFLCVIAIFLHAAF